MQCNVVAPSPSHPRASENSGKLLSLLTKVTCKVSAGRATALAAGSCQVSNQNKQEKAPCVLQGLTTLTVITQRFRGWGSSFENFLRGFEGGDQFGQFSECFNLNLIYFHILHAKMLWWWLAWNLSELEGVRLESLKLLGRQVFDFRVNAVIDGNRLSLEGICAERLRRLLLDLENGAGSGGRRDRLLSSENVLRWL